jgi:hypothetical protein
MIDAVARNQLHPPCRRAGLVDRRFTFRDFLHRSFADAGNRRKGRGRRTQEVYAIPRQFDTY